jgi:protein-tyrosine kinase
MSEITEADMDREFGWIPCSRSVSPVEGLQGLDPHLVSLVAPASFEAEHYRTLRARIETGQDGKELRVLAVTSAAVGDGKTTTAINLAGALAQSRETRVLLVDADLRRPSVSLQLGLEDPRGAGLADAILDPERPLESVILRGLPLNLQVLTSGRPPAAPYEVLKSPRFGALIEEARRSFDYVVVDTPPLIPVPDCRLITRWVDGILMVVAAHRTPRELLEEGLNLIDPAKVVGLVFNGDRRPHSGYYGYHQAYGRAPGPNRPRPRSSAHDPAR